MPDRPSGGPSDVPPGSRPPGGPRAEDTLSASTAASTPVGAGPPVLEPGARLGPYDIIRFLVDLAHAAAERLASRGDSEPADVVECASGLRARLEPLAPRARRAAAAFAG